MKNKLLSAVLASACILGCALTFTACAGEGEHTHDYSSEWSSDSTYHWHECSNEGCPEKQKDKAEHSDADEDGKCDECKYLLTDESGNENGSGNGSGDEEKKPDSMAGKTFAYSRWECPDPEAYESARQNFASMTFEFIGEYKVSITQPVQGRTLKGTYSQSGDTITFNVTQYVASSDGQTYDVSMTMSLEYVGGELKYSSKLPTDEYMYIYFSLKS